MEEVAAIEDGPRSNAVSAEVEPGSDKPSRHDLSVAEYVP